MFGSSSKTDDASVLERMQLLRDWTSAFLSLRALHNNGAVQGAIDKFFGITAHEQATRKDSGIASMDMMPESPTK
jgi:hypothetical protein